MIFFVAHVILIFLNAIPSLSEVVKFGACFQESSNSHRCATNSSFCIEEYGEQWFRPYELVQLDGRDLCYCSNTHTGHCSPSHGARGPCRYDEPACPADTERFSNRHYFYNDGASCHCTGLVGHVYSTNIIEFEEALYGGCQTGDGIRCVMSSWSCEMGEQWISPAAIEEQLGAEEQCTCDKVKVGACYHPLSSICAVDADSCSPTSEFISPLQALSRGLDCTLCSVDDLKIKEDEEDVKQSGGGTGTGGGAGGGCGQGDGSGGGEGCQESPDNDQEPSSSIENTTSSSGVSYSTFVAVVTFLSISVALSGIMIYHFSKIRKSPINERSSKAEVEVVDVIA